MLLQLLVGGMDGACGQRFYTLFVYLASLLIFYTSEKYLRGKAWHEMKSLFPFRSLSAMAKGWRGLLQGLPGTFYPLVSV